MGDPRVADLVQAGQIRVALFPPQYARDPATGELRPFGAGIVSMEIAREACPRASGERTIQSSPDRVRGTASALNGAFTGYWMPAFAGMTAERSCPSA
jgi:hypothetical protein